MPHDVPDSELRYVEVLRSDNHSCRSLPTGFECRGDNNVDAYFTAGEQYITIFTKTFSFYTCCKGQRNRLDLKAWVNKYFMSQVLEHFMCNISLFTVGDLSTKSKPIFNTLLSYFTNTLQLFCTYNGDTLEAKVYLSDDNPKDELLRSGQLRSGEIVLEKWRTVVLPDEFSEFTQKDKLRFLLVKVNSFSFNTFELN